MRLKSLYRVDSVPLLLRPFFHLYGNVVGAIIYLYIRLVHLTSRIEISGEPPGGNYLFCIWHYAWTGYFCLLRDHRRDVWMNHPLWYMIHIWRLAKFLAVREQIPGSTGHDGRLAAEKLIEALRRGGSTVMAPDGPAGPPKVMKSGALHIAAKSGVPIVAIRIESTLKITSKRWDKKEIPLPFGTIRARYSEPLVIDPNALDSEAEKARVTDRITEQLS